MHHLARYTPLTLLLLATAACNLTLDLDEHPYQGGATSPDDLPDELPPPVDVPTDLPLIPDTQPDLDAPPDDAPDTRDDADRDADMDMDVEEMPVGAPKLIFTEVLIDSSGGSPQNGEHIEVYNAGDGVAMLNLIAIVIFKRDDMTVFGSLTIPSVGSSPEQQDALNRLVPLAPGERFVFAKVDSGEFGIVAQLPPSALYEFKRWDNNTPFQLANASPRQLRLLYQGVLQDTLTWGRDGLIHPERDELTPLPVMQNRTFELRPEGYTAPDRRDPALWCLSDSPVPSSTAMLYATPGQPPGQCME